MRKLIDNNLNEKLIIEKIGGDYKLKRRLMELGFIKNAVIVILAKSILKKTLLINICNCVIAVRSDNLKEVYVCKK